jgi:hypothetical protein
MPVYENLVEKYVPEKPFLSNLQLKQSALLYIINSDILMDFVLPVPPNIILCGGGQCVHQQKQKATIIYTLKLQSKEQE